jgi:hypothetical protein
MKNRQVFVRKQERCQSLSPDRLDHRWSSLEQESLPEDFTQRVMDRLHAAQEAARPVQAGMSPESNRSTIPRARRFFRPELANALVATAATYLFISTGLMRTMFSLDSASVETGLYVKMTVFLDWVGRLAHSIPS